MRRIALAVSALATAFAVIAPASPAAASDPCRPTAYAPYMIDTRISQMDGPVAANCNQDTFWIRASAELHEYVDAATGWRRVGSMERLEKDSRYTFADAFYGCKGQGYRYFTTKGMAAAAFPPYGSYFESPLRASGYVKVNCGAPPPVPLIGH